jgi:hypothetical protein
LLERTEAAVAVTRLAKGSGGGGRQSGYEHELLARLKVALADEDLDAIDTAMEALKDLPLVPDARDALSSITEHILSADFTKAADALERFLNSEA